MFLLFVIYIIFSWHCYLICGDVDLDLDTNNELTVNDLPIYWDWRESNKVTPVKDQGECNACWAFSITANIESHLMIYLNMNESLSEQFLINCDGRSIGCSSTSILKTFSIIVDTLGGVLRTTDYKPYTGQLSTCDWNQIPKPVPVVGYRRVKNDEATMAIFLHDYGPLSAGINSASMAIYRGGIDEPTDEICPPNNLNHAVLIVGYNVYIDPATGKSTPYWIIKNSWGTNWGDHGYYYLVRGRNACGIANTVSFGIVN